MVAKLSQNVLNMHWSCPPMGGIVVGGIDVVVTVVGGMIGVGSLGDRGTGCGGDTGTRGHCGDEGAAAGRSGPDAGRSSQAARTPRKPRHKSSLGAYQRMPWRRGRG